MKKLIIFILICVLIGAGLYFYTQNIFIYNVKLADGFIVKEEYNGTDFAAILEQFFGAYAEMKFIDIEKLDVKETFSFFFDGVSLFVKTAFKNKMSENLFVIGESISSMSLILLPALFFAFLDMFFKKINIFTILKAILGVMMLVGVGIMIYSIIVLPEYIKNSIAALEANGIGVENYEIKFTLFAYLIILTRLLASVLLIIPIRKAKAK